jgi:hypothetical protein
LIRPKNASVSGRIGQRITALLERGESADDPYAHYRKRLVKVVGDDGAAILRALFSETPGRAAGVNGDRFRIRFKDSRDKIQRLAARFIEEDFRAGRVYRPGS